MMSKLKNMEIAVPEWDNDNTAQGQVNRMSHMMSMANIHKENGYTQLNRAANVLSISRYLFALPDD